MARSIIMPRTKQLRRPLIDLYIWSHSIQFNSKWCQAVLELRSLQLSKLVCQYSWSFSTVSLLQDSSSSIAPPANRFRRYVWKCSCPPFFSRRLAHNSIANRLTDMWSLSYGPSSAISSPLELELALIWRSGCPIGSQRKQLWALFLSCSGMFGVLFGLETSAFARNMS